MTQGLMDVILHQPFTVCHSFLREKPVHLRKHTTFCTAMPSPTHVLTTGSASSGVAGVKERGKNGSKGSSNTNSEKAWEEEGRIGLDDETALPEVLQVLEKFKDRCSCRLEKKRLCYAQDRTDPWGQD